jgi:hypothetical protein
MQNEIFEQLRKVKIHMQNGDAMQKNACGVIDTTCKI